MTVAEATASGGGSSPDAQLRLRFSGDDADLADGYLRRLHPDLTGLLLCDDVPGENENCISVACSRSQSAELVYDSVTGVRHNEGYTLRLGSGEDLIRYASERGLRNALTTLAQLVLSGISQVEITDAPRFPIRGIIEGYYGEPWTDAQRRDVMRLLASRKMNAYFYGPKDDLYHRELWREPYPNTALHELASLLDYAQGLGLDFWYTIGPGLSIEYSNETDFRSLIAKLEGIRAIGINRIGLLFDDIPPTLQHESDRSTFASTASAHATVANRLFAELRSLDVRTQLVVCPTVYCGRGDEPYIAELGALLDPRINVFWSGPEICSRELTLHDAALLARTLHRRQLYWDNYPVNDLEMQDELHVGPYRGRDQHLYRMAHGVIANVMQNSEAAKIPLLTVADYLWNPEAYEPEGSWQASIATVVGPNDADAFLPFADCNRYSSLYRTDAPFLADQLQRAGFLRSTARQEEAIAVLNEAVHWLEQSVQLFDRGMTNHTLQRELGPWIDAYRSGVDLLRVIAEELGGDDPNRKRISRFCAAYQERTAYTFADVLNPLVRKFGNPRT